MVESRQKLSVGGIKKGHNATEDDEQERSVKREGRTGRKTELDAWGRGDLVSLHGIGPRRSITQGGGCQGCAQSETRGCHS